MNTAIFETGPLELETFQAREVLRCAWKPARASAFAVASSAVRDASAPPAR